MRYYLIVGEASGDLHASHLMQALKRRDEEAEFRFFGGDLMTAVGGTRVKHYRELAYMGFIPVMLHLKTILKNMKMCKQDIVQWQPDVVILVDYPGFNLDIAKYVHSLKLKSQSSNLKVYYYISPKIWAWKEYRIKNIKRDVDELFSILPFEVPDGVHLSDAMIRLVAKAKGPEGVLLITDAMRAAACPDGLYELGGLRVRVEHGRATLADVPFDPKAVVSNVAGSVALFPTCFRRWARLCGFPLHEAVKAAGWNQLRSLGVRDRGDIAPGQRADLVLLDSDYTPVATLSSGRVIAT